MRSNDFSQGRVWRNIVAQSIPLILAQLVQLLYNVVDRIYIGNLPGADRDRSGIPVDDPDRGAHLSVRDGRHAAFSIARGAEPISNAIGGLACFVIMYFSLYRKLECEEKV